MAFGNQFQRQCFEANKEQAEAFYKGQNIANAEGNNFAKGDVLIRHHGQPLGLAKPVKQTLKNNLPRELIRDNVSFTADSAA